MSDIEIEFDAEEKDIASWEAIFSVLDETIGGAKLQDAMSVFGSEVDDKLEGILEEFGGESFNLGFWERENLHFRVGIENSDFFLVEEFKELFGLCPVENLSVSME